MSWRPKGSLAERLWAWFDRDAKGCWVWRGHTNVSDGYGRISVDGRPVVAHRAMYELLVEPIPEGLQLDHLCRNRRCLNPAHLEPVTQVENVRRGFAARLPAPTCKNGHPFDSENTAIRTSGPNHRRCRECAREASARYKARVAGAVMEATR